MSTMEPCPPPRGQLVKFHLGKPQVEVVAWGSRAELGSHKDKLTGQSVGKDRARDKMVSRGVDLAFG